MKQILVYTFLVCAGSCAIYFSWQSYQKDQTEWNRWVQYEQVNSELQAKSFKDEQASYKKQQELFKDIGAQQAKADILCEKAGHAGAELVTPKEDGTFTYVCSNTSRL